MLMLPECYIIVVWCWAVDRRRRPGKRESQRECDDAKQTLSACHVVWVCLSLCEWWRWLCVCQWEIQTMDGERTDTLSTIMEEKWRSGERPVAAILWRIKRTLFYIPVNPGYVGIVRFQKTKCKTDWPLLCCCNKLILHLNLYFQRSISLSISAVVVVVAGQRMESINMPFKYGSRPNRTHKAM